MNKMHQEALRLLRNHKYEARDDGSILLGSGSGLVLAGVFGARYTPPGGKQGVLHVACNRVVTEGLIKILGLLGGHVSSATLYLAPYSGSATPDATWTGANFDTNATEFTAYTSATRLPWTTVAPTTPLLTNAAALAAATMTLSPGGPYTIRGCSLIESSVKEGTTGKLIVAAPFDAALTGLTGGGKLALEYGIAAMDAADA